MQCWPPSEGRFWRIRLTKRFLKCKQRKFTAVRALHAARPFCFWRAGRIRHVASSCQAIRVYSHHSRAGSL
jgi:hypothetical protein